MKESLRDLNKPNSLRNKFRRKRLKYLFNFIQKVISNENKTELNICDLGGNYLYWSIFPFNNFPEVTFNITLINIESSKLFERNDNFDNVNFFIEIGDCCNLNWVDNHQFDVVHSNSLIEHVGDWERVKKMANEVSRVGKHHFIQTPNFWFFIEPHYMLPLVHFFPRPLQTFILQKAKKYSFDVATKRLDENRLLSKKEIKFLFPDSNIIKEKLALYTKSFIACSKLSNQV